VIGGSFALLILRLVLKIRNSGRQEDVLNRQDAKDAKGRGAVGSGRGDAGSIDARHAV